MTNSRDNSRAMLNTNQSRLLTAEKMADVLQSGLLGLVQPAWLGLDMTGCKNASLTRAILAFLSVL